MKALLKGNSQPTQSPTIAITGSKSESNRLLLLQALYPNITIENLSNSDDTKALQKGIVASNEKIDVHHAGTAMRFLTAYYASREGVEIEISGSKRMHQRPIKILVDALREMGAKIEYLKEEGYPPLRIFGKKLLKNYVNIQANVSSQYISALALVAPSLPEGLTIELQGKITSTPYIEMTLALLKRLGIACSMNENIIKIAPKSKIDAINVVVESDWSSASYFYSLVALSEMSSVTLSHYSEESIQGDAALVAIYGSLGVSTTFNASERSITLTKDKTDLPDFISLDLSETPDIAQTIVVSCFGLGIGCKLTGLHTLKIKETDRLLALKSELEKLGAQVHITNDSIELASNPTGDLSEAKETAVIQTYQDHRMAMAFAPLALLFPIIIDDPMVVSKSFPSYWKEIAKMGLTVDFK